MHTVVIEYYNEMDDKRVIGNVAQLDATDDRYFRFDTGGGSILVRHSAIKSIDIIKEKE